MLPHRIAFNDRAILQIHVDLLCLFIHNYPVNLPPSTMSGYSVTAQHNTEQHKTTAITHNTIQQTHHITVGEPASSTDRKLGVVGKCEVGRERTSPWSSIFVRNSCQVISWCGWLLLELPRFSAIRTTTGRTRSRHDIGGGVPLGFPMSLGASFLDAAPWPSWW